MAKILIAGCGDIGRALGNLLTEAGHQVTGLKRQPLLNSQDKFPYFQADLTVKSHLNALQSDYEYVFFIASPDRRENDSYRKIYDTGLSNLAGRLSHADWFFVSSTSVYGQNQGEWVDEDSAATGSSASSRLIVAAEQYLNALNSNNIIIRFSGIYGPGREYLINQARQNPVIQKHPPYYTNRIHRQDCVAVLAFMLNQRLKGVELQSCYLASDDYPATLWEVMTWLCGQLRCPPPAAKAVDAAAVMNKRCRNDRLKALGYRFLYADFRQGYGAVLSGSALQN